VDRVQIRLSIPELVEASLCRKEAVLLSNGALTAATGQFTGRSPKDKYFVVSEAVSSFPREMHQWVTEEQFEGLLSKVKTHLSNQGSFQFDGAVNHHPTYRTNVRFYTEYAWHNLFVRNLFIPTDGSEHPEYTVFCAPNVRADPVVDGTRGETFVVLHPARGIVLIGGTEYAGEMKKSIFTMMHHHLVERQVTPMHCSASVGEAGDVALFFGLSGTGKTTLSADPKRQLIGDDEHGWSADGVFNMENGCYAKCIDLSQKKEPDIYDAISFGAILENVVYDATRAPDYGDKTLTENTRAAYPLSHVRNVEPSGRGGHPSAIIFLSADATGVLPAVARLTPEDARKHYLLGYTSKLAGTERGVTQPEATFSACFASPFLIHQPTRYADMLMEQIVQYNVPVYLLNTGWVGGGYGETSRMPLALTRGLVDLILSGQLNHVETKRDDNLWLSVPVAVPGIPEVYLNPAAGFSHSDTFTKRKANLAKSFHMALDTLGVSDLVAR